MKRTLLMAAFAGWLSHLLMADTSYASEEAALKALLERLPGAFDSETQMRSEKAEAVDPEADVPHGWVHRTFTKINTPDIGEHVFVSTVHYNGKDGYFDKAEFQVWTLRADDDGVTMSPQRFVDPDKFIAKIGSANAFDSIQPSDLAPPQGSAGCDIYWQMSDGVLRGATDPSDCRWMSTVQKTELVWDWQYELRDEIMLIRLAGRNDAGEILSGPKDNSPWHLERVN